MKVAYPMRVDALDKPGGDLVQVQKYIAGAAAISTAFSGTILVDLNADFSSFDIVHLTNLDRPAELYHYFIRAREQRKPIVLSTIHHSYSEIERFEREARQGMVRIVSGHLSFQTLELMRCMVRSVKYPHLLACLAKLIPVGTKEAQKSVLDGAHCILVLTEKERTDIDYDVGPVKRDKTVCIRNGIEADVLGRSDVTSEERDIDVCVVGRIEARKNQLAILDAVNTTGRSAVFVGKENPNHPRYCAQFKKEIAESTSTHAGSFSHPETLALMRRAKVHVSASWFEVSSLVDIEAYAAGCRVISSVSGGTKELLGDKARYVDPGSPAELVTAISQALLEQQADVKRPDVFCDTWSSVTRKLAAVYQNVLDQAEHAVD